MDVKHFLGLLTRGRVAAMIAACAIIVGGAAGGTVAWLVGETAPVTNTFMPASIGVTVTESDSGDGDNDPNTNSYTMVPGAQIAKDPEVTVAAGSESAWLFAELKKGGASFDDYLTFELAEGWTQLTVEGSDVDGVYYRKVEKMQEAQTFGLIKDNLVTVKPEVTTAMLNELTLEGAQCPTLTVTAYAVQQHGFDSAEAAWKEINPITPPTP